MNEIDSNSAITGVLFAAEENERVLLGKTYSEKDLKKAVFFGMCRTSLNKMWHILMIFRSPVFKSSAANYIFLKLFHIVSF